MAIMELNKFLAKIKSGDFAGRFIFAGEEEFLIRHYLRELAGAVVTDEAFAAFNHVVFDGGEIDFAKLADAIEAPPMFSEYKLVEWRYADFLKLKEKELASFAELAEFHKSYPYTVLAISAISGSLDFGTQRKPGKHIEKLRDYDILRFERSKKEQLYSWIGRHFKSLNIKISLPAATALVERVGCSMDVIKGEIDKLSAYVLANGADEVTESDIAAVCPNVPENDNYAFQNALIERNRAKAFSALEEMKLERIDPIRIFSMISGTYSELLDIMLLLKDGKSREDIAKMLKMHIYRVGIYVNNSRKHTPERMAALVDALADFDVGMKRGGITGYTAIEIFISQYI